MRLKLILLVSACEKSPSVRLAIDVHKAIVDKYMLLLLIMPPRGVVTYRELKPAEPSEFVPEFFSPPLGFFMILASPRAYPFDPSQNQKNKRGSRENGVKQGFSGAEQGFGDAACSTIYLKDHANGGGGVTGGETVVEPTMGPNEASPKVPQKKKRTGDAIPCLLGDMKGSFHDALKSLEPLPLPQVIPSTEIRKTLEMIPDFSRGGSLRSYGKLILSERLVELPMDFRKE
ncbi:hypothetical protein D1007_19799 [Hordeum vulgare]|nr:hypothetical protein D1007_19799 [Hordeum vulgare]